MSLSRRSVDLASALDVNPGLLQSHFQWGFAGRRPPRNILLWGAHKERVARDAVPRAPDFATALPPNARRLQWRTAVLYCGGRCKYCGS